MADIKRHISHLKSSGSTAPLADNLIDGEIAVGYGKGNEALYIKNSDGEIVTFLSSGATVSTAVAMANWYTDDRVITTITGDGIVSGSLNAVDVESESGRTLTLAHKNDYTAQSGFKKLSTDTHGHVTGSTDVALSDLTGLGAVSSARTVSAGEGLSGGGALSADVTIYHPTAITAGSTSSAAQTPDFGGTFNIPTISYDKFGHITGTSTATVTLPNESAEYISAVTASASGINVSVTDKVLTVGHTNNITAGSAKTSSDAVTATTSGANIEIPVIEYDANGHVKSTGSTNVSLKVNAASPDTAGVIKIATATGTNDTDTVMTQKAVSDGLSAKADTTAMTTALSSKFGAVSYNSTDKKIYFYAASTGETPLANIDAKDFIKDGMVDNVEVKEVAGSGTCLVITFNTFDGTATHETINLPISDIFNASNYYTKSEVDSALSGKANTAITITAGTGLSGGGDLSENRTISLAATGTSGTYKQVVVDEYGRVTSGNSEDLNYYINGASVTTAVDKFDVSLSGNNEAASASFTIPSATTTAAGVMTSADKVALNNLNPLSGKVSTLSAITATSTAINSLTGTVGTMAFENATNYSSATQVSTALGGKSDTGHKHVVADITDFPSLPTTIVSAVSLTSGATDGTLKLNVNGVDGSDVSVPGLGGAAFLNTGTTANTVAAGDHTHSEYVNQDAFSVISDGTNTVSADSTTDTVTFAVDSKGGLSITASDSNDTVTFGLGDIICGDY